MIQVYLLFEIQSSFPPLKSPHEKAKWSKACASSELTPRTQVEFLKTETDVLDPFSDSGYVNFRFNS